MSPSPNDEHQEVVANLVVIFGVSVAWPGLGLIRPEVNVSDRVAQWEHNFRCPDVVVYLRGTAARNLGTHWVGGPDFGVEVISRDDRSREKLAFYAAVGARELLLVDRYPWALELYRLAGGVLQPAVISSPDRPDWLTSEVLPLGFRLVGDEPRPVIEVAHSDGVQRWSA